MEQQPAKRARVDSLRITQPDDFHLHVRDGEMTKLVLPLTAQVFGRAIIMPNLQPPVTTTAQASLYHQRLLAALPSHLRAFRPLMTLYLTDATPPEEIVKAKESGFVFGVKLYPAGATTNSASGVTDVAKVHATLRKMEEVGLPLLIHGEVTDVDIFDREAEFITRKLAPLLRSFPDLRVVVEHVTTHEMVDFVKNSSHKHLAATITPHHLLYSRNELFKPPGMAGTALNPHLFCLPVLKAERHRAALVEVATSGHPRFFAGTDSAPHYRKSKEAACCSAGVFAAPIALEVYATVFDAANALDKLEAFTSLNGSAFYGLEPNKRKVDLVRADQKVPPAYKLNDDDGKDLEVVPLCAGGSVGWQAKLLEE